MPSSMYPNSYPCIVDGQTITADCDDSFWQFNNNHFSFTFDSIWDNTTKNIVWIKNNEETIQSITDVRYVFMPESGETNIEEYDFYIVGTNDTATIRTNTYHFERGSERGGTLTLIEEYNEVEIEPITIDCTDKTLTITNVPLISNVSNTVIQFTFCPKWNGFTNTVKFYDDSGTLYEVGITDNQATIPEALLIESSCFFFYILGTNGDLKRQSQVFKCRYSSGELTVENADNDVLIRLMELIQDQGNEINELRNTIIESADLSKPPIGIPIQWFTDLPEWALDFGNGASTQYLWSNYPNLNNDEFKAILTTLSNNGWCSAYDSSGFYVPDLRGIVPIGYGTNARRTTESCIGGNIGAYSASSNKAHTHNTNWTYDTGAFWMQRYTTDPVYGVWKKLLISGYNWGTFKHEDDGATNGYIYYMEGSVPTNSNGASASKPSTIGCMWIVRFK